MSDVSSRPSAPKDSLVTAAVAVAAVAVAAPSLLVKPGHSKRTDFSLIPSRTALLIIDVQDHLSSSEATVAKEKDAYLYSTALKKTIPNMVQLVDAFRTIRDDNSEEENLNCKCEVIFTYLEALTPDRRDISLDYKLSGPLLSTALPSSITKATFDELPMPLHPDPTTGKGDILIPKTSCSVFLSTNINYILRNLHIEQIVVCGQFTDQCVLSAVRDAADLGYFVSVAEDACAASSSSEHLRGILGMKGFARIISTREILEEIRRGVGERMLNSQSNAIQLQRILHDKEDSRLEHGALFQQQPLTLTSPSFLSQKWNSLQIWQPYQAPSGLLETLFHTLQCANIKFLRYVSIDVTNSLRTKVIPIHNLLQTYEVYNKVAIAKVCIGGLPSFADLILPETGLNAQHVLMIQPDMSSLRILPYTKSTAMVFGTLHRCSTSATHGVNTTNMERNQLLGPVSEYCTRSLLQRVLHFAKNEHGIGFAVGVEIEFILVRQLHNNHHLKEKPQSKEPSLMDIIEPIDSTVFASTTTLNEQDEFLNNVYDALQKQNITIETFHSESAPGQLEVVIPYQKDAVKVADMVILTRETIKAMAKNHGLCALFLPKVFDDSAGNGMHVHLSLYSINDPSKNLFPTTGARTSSSSSSSTSFHHTNHQALQNLMSNVGQSFLEGILTHLKALTSLTMPTSNSYNRVGEGCWTGHTVDWMVEEKECPLRVCLGWSSAKSSFEASNVELKLIDNSCNIYLALASILFSGMDGIMRGMQLRQPRGKDTGGGDYLTTTSASRSASLDKLPQSLEESLDCLSNDSILSNLLGEKLKESYVAVKKAEIQHDEGRSIVTLVEEALKR